MEKNYHQVTYYEDENVLVYASFKGDFDRGPNRDVDFDIEVLDKKTEETTSFKSDVPFLEKYQLVEYRRCSSRS